LDNNWIRKILQEFELLINSSVYDRECLTKYRNCIQDYRSAMGILREKHEFTDEKIKEFQFLIDSWFQNWNLLWSIEGCTNYTHLLLLSSGHMTDFMYKWRNLYRFSLSGLGKIQPHFFHLLLSADKSCDHSVKSKLVPVGRWLQRRLLWMIGYGDQIICGDQINIMNDLRLQDESSDDD
jgi:hypothetical protein